MAKQEYLYPKVPEKDKDGNLASDEVIKFCRNILELFKIKVSKDNKNNEDISGSTYSIATEAEAIAGESEDTIITPLGLRQGLNADGDAPIYACRAWVNFNGTGTVAIRGSGNVSSITDNGAGYYTVNLTIEMEDANYSYQIIASIAWSISVYSQTTTSLRFGTQANTTYFKDYENINTTIFR